MRKILIPLILISILSLAPFTAFSETIDVQIKGVDDGVKTRKQQDYKEAVLFAKREAIERAGVQIKSMTTVKDFVLNSDYIEQKAEAVLLPGYNIIDVGYQQDGTYLVILVGKVKTIVEGIESKELRYAKSLMDRGESSKARKIIADIIENSKDDNVVAEAMYCQVLWKFALDARDTFEKLKAYYPNSKYVGRLTTLLKERKRREEEEDRRKTEEDRRLLGNVSRQDGKFIAHTSGVVRDAETGLEWVSAPDQGITWHQAKQWAQNLNIPGGQWRMPTLRELKTLYQEAEKRGDLGSTTPLLLINYPEYGGVWSGDRYTGLDGGSGPFCKRGCCAKYMDFRTGSLRSWAGCKRFKYYRAFAVRYRERIGDDRK